MKFAVFSIMIILLIITGCTQPEVRSSETNIETEDLFGGETYVPYSPNEGEIVIEKNPGPGPYVGTAIGYYEYGGTVTVTLEVSSGKLTSVNVTGPRETAGIGSQAIDTMGGAMLKANSIMVDKVSGATHSSDAVLKAAARALGKAGLTDADLKR